MLSGPIFPLQHPISSSTPSIFAGKACSYSDKSDKNNTTISIVYEPDVRWLLVRTGKPSAEQWQEERLEAQIKIFESISFSRCSCHTTWASSSWWVYSHLAATCCGPSFPLLTQSLAHLESCPLWLLLSPTSKRFILFNTRVLSMLLAITTAPEQKSFVIVHKNLHIEVSFLNSFPVHYWVIYKMYQFLLFPMDYFIRGNNKPVSFWPAVMDIKGPVVLAYCFYKVCVTVPYEGQS